MWESKEKMKKTNEKKTIDRKWKEMFTGNYSHLKRNDSQKVRRERSVYNVDEDIYNERRVESRGHRLPW